MTAKFRIGAELSNFFNPGAPINIIIVTDITDAYFEIEYTDNVGGTHAVVFPWRTVNSFEVLSD